MDEVGKKITMERSAFPNFDLLDPEIYNDSCYPLSLPSQPPDIRNWISSYESELSADSAKDAYFHRSQELSESETQDPFEDSRKRKLQELCLSPEKERYDGVLGKDMCARNYTLNSTMEIFRMKCVGTDSVVAKKKQSLRNILGEEFLTNCQKTIIDQSILPEMDKIEPRGDDHDEPKSNMLEGKECKEKLEKNYQELSSNNSEQKKEDQILHKEEKPLKNTSKADFISPQSRPKLLSSNNSEQNKEDQILHKDEKPLKNTSKSDFISPQSKPKLLCSNNSEQNKEDQILHKEEKLLKNTSEADFIPPKSGPKLHGNQENESNNRGNFDKEGHNSGGFRRLLIDKSNNVDKDRDGGFRDTPMNKTDFSVDVVPIKELSSGKWQCPRKRKPYVGPPLKQLRLEQWINRAS